MSITPTLVNVGQLFIDHTFKVPRYQRNYAWDAEQISDFLKDLELCVEARRAGNPREHFFGGLVMVRADVPGSARQNMELIDGQQRMASFKMLAAQVRQAAQRLALTVDPTLKVDPAKPATLKEFLEKFADIIEGAFLQRTEKSGLNVFSFDRLELSEPDSAFFKDLLRNKSPKPTRASHELLADAWKRIGEWIDGVIDAGADDKVKAGVLSDVHTVMTDDWVLIRMVTDSKPEAIRLFRVLNDRGASLTDGDLIRARLLEELEGVAASHETNKVVELWDKILGDQPEGVEKQLHAIFSSRTGKRAGKSTLLDQFMDDLFPETKVRPMSKASASEVVGRVEEIYQETVTITQLEDGDWPYHPGEVSGWDRSRLKLLMSELKHTNCLPLLLSARLLTEARFSEIVQVLERFMFRYKVICGAHIGQATKVYHEEAVAIRKNPGAYKIQDLRAKLGKLIDKHAADPIFRADLLKLTYTRNAGNKSLRYFMITMESYWRWGLNGAQGAPKVIDKMQAIDPALATLEHIYPNEAAPQDAALQPLVNTLGNITLLCPKDNDAAGNRPFADKKAIFATSPVGMNKTLSALAQWDHGALLARQEALQDLAVKVFSV